MRSCKVIVLAASLAFVLGARAQEVQGAIEPRKFLPRDYNVEGFVDVEALLDSGLFDLIERSWIRPLMESFARVHGFHLEDLHTFRWAERQSFDENGWQQSASVMVFEGNQKVGLGQVAVEMTGWAFERKQIGGIDVLTDAGVETWVSPRPGSLVEGDSSVVDATLSGEHVGGVPVPDLLALTAGRGTIALIAGLVGGQFERLGELAPIPSEWFDPEDPPHALMLRLSRSGEGQGMVLEFRLRFRDGEGGAERFAACFAEWMKMLREDQQLRLLAPTLGRTQHTVDHADFLATLDIERPEQVFSIVLNTFGSFGALIVREVADAVAVRAEAEAIFQDEEPEEEPEEEPPAGPADHPHEHR